MRYLSIWKAVETNVPPSPDEILKMGELIEDMTKKGELIATEGCLPSALGARVRKSGTKVTITDGPFTETKELIAGFALLEAESKKDAIEMCKRFMDVAGDGECEIRQIYAAPPDAAVSAQSTESARSR
jgi:hypothetical protein